MMNSVIRPYKSLVVHVGQVALGGNNPIRLQSMTNTDTLDTKASVAQCIRIIEAGADLVRLTAQGVREAENLALIKRELRKAGFSNPLVADIHFNPAAAETAARIVEKVRINPGNYADKRASFIKQELSDSEYELELEKTHARLLPLISVCREHSTAIRVGINHGSLSDRIMTRYGNTPAGMVASALEFIRIFRSENFSSLVLSMKSSDTAVMIEATRMLAVKMQQEGFCFPLHLGVTEAGEGEDGRIRSAAGIGALLADGIGDTIRVSLSEDPELEIPVAQMIARCYPRGTYDKMGVSSGSYPALSSKPAVLRKINGPLVVTNMTSFSEIGPSAYAAAGFRLHTNGESVVATDGSADLLIASECPPVIPPEVRLVIPFKKWMDNMDKTNVFPLFSPETYHESSLRSGKLNLLLTGPHFDITYLREPNPETTMVLFVYHPEKEPYAADIFFKSLSENGIQLPVVLNPVFRTTDEEEIKIRAASLLGKYLTDRTASGISITAPGELLNEGMTALAFSILQCTASRITRTMYLSCPTCGRTKFKLQDAVRKVKAATAHLKGLKIAVMGCIVNGPGEMAGSDYGYVGAGNGKVHIYRGTEAVLKNVAEEEAVDELLALIEKDQAMR